MDITVPEFPSILSILAVVACILLNDVSWALYVRRVGEGAAVKAGMWASGIYMSGIVATISVLHNYWLIAVAVLTTFFGTTATIKLDKYLKGRKKHGKDVRTVDSSSNADGQRQP